MTVEEITEALKAVGHVIYERVLFGNPGDEEQVFHSWLVTDRVKSAARFSVSDTYLGYLGEDEMAACLSEGRDMLQEMKQRSTTDAV